MSSTGERIYLIRRALGPNPRKELPQPAFAALLNSLGFIGDGTKVSLLENDRQEPSLAEVAIIAAVDPQRRGKLWLGWNETADATMQEPTAPYIQDDGRPYQAAPVLEQKKRKRGA